MTRKLEILLVALILLAVPAPGLAQSPLGTILGTVRDQTGGVVPEANVVVADENRGFKRSTTSNASGDYRVDLIMEGTYKLTVEKEGFKKYEQVGVALLARQILRLDAALTLGQRAESVTVTGAAPVVNSETVTISETVNQQKLNSYVVPLPMQFSMAYWVMRYTLQGSDVDYERIGGVRDEQNRTNSDGAPVDFSSVGPPPVAINEVKLTSVGANAEFAVPVTLDMTTRGGSNAFHAVAEYRFDNPALNSLGPYTSKRGPGSANYYSSFSGSGPFIIPHVYDGRNRTFWLVSYDRQKNAQSTWSSLFTVPTVRMRTGDFSEVRDGSGNVIPIYDPRTGAQFPDNKIPDARISSVAKNALANYYYLPNTGSTEVPLRNYNMIAKQGSIPNQAFFRIDQKLKEADTLSFSFTRRRTIDKFDACGSGREKLCGYWQASQKMSVWTYALGETHVFSPRVVNEFRVAYNRILMKGGLDGAKGQPVLSTLGIQGIDPALDVEGLPDISITGMAGIGQIYADASSIENRFNYIDNLTWQTGKHTVKLGANLIKIQENSMGAPKGTLGTYNFTGRFTQGSAGQGGNGWADFLLGFPDTTAKYTPRVATGIRSSGLGLYVQDDWKITPRLTLNLGLRYDLDGIPYDKNGLYFSFDPKNGALVLPSQFAMDHMSPLFNSLIPRELASVVGYPSKLIEPDRNNLYPRLGLAFRPFKNAKTVLRAGYGIFTAGKLGGLARFSTGSWVNTGGPFALSESFTNTITPGQDPDLKFPNPFPSGLGAAATSYGLTAFNPKIKDAYTQQWNLTFEREFWKTAMRVSYVGNKSTSLVYQRNINLPPPSTIPFDISACGVQALRPNPTCRRNYYGFSNVNWAENGANDIYHSFQIEFTRPMAKGLQLHAGYIWMKELTDSEDAGWWVSTGSGATNPYDRWYDRGITLYIPASRVLFDWVYELPMGKGKHFDTKNAVLNHLLGGWSTSAFLRFNSGLPGNPTYSGTDPSGMGKFGGRPDRIGSGQLANPTADRWFDPSAFTIPASNIGRFGNSARSIINQPGWTNFRLAMFKNFALTERLRMRLGCYMDNPFNQHEPGWVNFNISDTTNVGKTGAPTGLWVRNIQFTAKLEF